MKSHENNIPELITIYKSFGIKMPSKFG